MQVLQPCLDFKYSVELPFKRADGQMGILAGFGGLLLGTLVLIKQLETAGRAKLPNSVQPVYLSGGDHCEAVRFLVRQGDHVALQRR